MFQNRVIGWGQLEVFFLLLAAQGMACSDKEALEDYCGRGVTSSIDGAKLCIYEQSIVIETGFRCPKDRSIRYDRETYTVCCDRELSEDQVLRAGESRSDVIELPTDVADIAQIDVDPTKCDPRRVTSVLSFGGLGQGSQLYFDEVAFAVATEQFASFEETQAMLLPLCTSTGPCYASPGGDEGSFGELEYFYAAPSDFGGALFIDRQTFDPVFAGTIVWDGRGERYWPSMWHGAETLSFGSSPVPPEFSEVVVAPSAYWPLSPQVLEAWELTRTTDLLADYSACGDFSVVVWVYTPTVGVVSQSAARVLVMVTGQTTGRWLVAN